MNRDKQMNMTGGFSLGSSSYGGFHYESSYSVEETLSDEKPYLVSYNKASTIFGIVVLALSYTALFLIGLTS